MDIDPPESIDRRVAGRIHARRTELGITLQALARQIGVAFQQAHKYERGRSRISAGRLYHVARALHVPVGFFFAAAEDADQAKPGPEADRRDNRAGDIDTDELGRGTCTFESGE
jgi:transcriptional regulator with XRE-family HTH domain